MDHYEQGNVKSFKELTDRAGDVLWSATKGALSAEAFSAAGEIPVPGAIADNTLASTAGQGFVSGERDYDRRRITGQARPKVAGLRGFGPDGGSS